MMSKTLRWGSALLMACALALTGCAGADGADGQDGIDGKDGVAGADGAPGADGTDGVDGTIGPTGATGATGSNGQDLTATAKAESCTVCHSTSGSGHQAIYNDYKDTAFNLTVDSVVSTANGDGKFTSTVTFTITKDGLPYMDPGLAGLDQKRYYAAAYDSTTKKFTTAFSYSNPTHLGNGQYTVTNTAATFAPETSNAQVYLYIGDGALKTEGMTLYSDVKNIGQAFGDSSTYASTANVAGCEKCHGAPYMKHGYRAAAVEGLPDFAACKSCHTDSRVGGHQGWQLLVDDPLAYATQDGVLTAAQKATYAYTANVMNDTHMSHAMEFAYPQSMGNCVTCHEGKLNLVLTDANFTVATCKSCHAVTGNPLYPDSKRAPPLKSVVPTSHQSWDLYANTQTCNGCHSATSGIPGAKTFSQIHPGYDTMIYTADGTRFADVFKVTIDSASLTGSTLNIKFSATETPDLPNLAVTSITPTVLVGLYGYDTKDFIVSAHGKDAQGNRLLEYVVGTTHPRFTTVSAANGQWEVNVNLTDWAGLVTEGTVRRMEIGVMPALKDAANVTLALNAPTKTFDIATNAFDDFYAPIVKVDGCNNCHDALSTTFHSGNRSGNVVMCRMCHTTREGGSHLEMQSRSIDSYVHAIHSFQPFDIGDVDFTDPVEKLKFEHHAASTYPNFTIMNCESCHNPETYDVPDQARSLLGTFSAADAVAGRTIGAVPSYVAGPGSRACGSCHRADLINEDKASELAAFNQHTASFGTLLESGDGVLDQAIAKIMALFN